MLVLVDEIFKGTNSADRIIGAQAAIRKLTHPWMMTVVTTHDFELCALADSDDIHGKNYHFEEHYEGDTIAFDYKIRPGRCMTTNAKHLMRIAGLLDADDVVAMAWLLFAVKSMCQRAALPAVTVARVVLLSYVPTKACVPSSTSVIRPTIRASVGTTAPVLSSTVVAPMILSCACR